MAAVPLLEGCMGIAEGHHEDDVGSGTAAWGE